MAAPTPMGAMSTIPPELREMVYDFASVITPTSKLDCLYGTPKDVLRLVSKEIHDESAPTLDEAAEEYNKERVAVFQRMIAEYQRLLATGPNTPAQVTQIQQKVVLATSLLTVNPACQHQCAHPPATGNKTRTLCYRCPDPARARCFSCGKWLALALWYDLHPADIPSLIVLGSGGNPTPLGKLIASLKRRHYRINGVWVWAFVWWDSQFQIQKAIDLRCCIRRKAIADHFKMRMTAPTERDILAAEICDRRWDRTVLVLESFKVSGQEWRAEYNRRAAVIMEKMRMDGKRVLPLIPLYRAQRDRCWKDE